MPDDTLDLDEIERLAKEATPGPWRSCWRDQCALDEQTIVVSDSPDVEKIDGANLVVGMIWYDGPCVAVTEPNAAYIAHMHPARVLALVERARESDDIVDQWRAVHARLEADLATERDARKKAEGERDAATREAETCKAIIKHCGGSFVVKCMLCGAPYDVRDPDWLKHDLTCPKHPMRDVERERDALARRMRVIEMRIFPLAIDDDCFTLDYPSGPVAAVLNKLTICGLGAWPTAVAALDAAADALEAAGMMGEESDHA